MNLVIEEEISSDTLKKLAEAYNELETRPTPVLHIFFSSGGGDSTAGEAIIELINRYKEITTLTVYSFIQSMAFDIFFKVKCQRVILSTTIGMAHLHRWSTNVKDGGTNLDYFDDFKKEVMKANLKPRIAFYKELGLREDEIQWITDGEDLFLDAKRLEKMLKLQLKNEVRRNNT